MQLLTSGTSGDLAGADSSQALTKPDGVSTVPTMVRGDWVLFHPVYTPEELKAVEVSFIVDIWYHTLIRNRLCVGMRRHSPISLHPV